MDLPRLKQLPYTFTHTDFGTPKEVRDSIDGGGKPVAIVATCSELGSEVDLLAGAESGQLAVVQTAGGLFMLPNYNPGDTSAFGALFDDSRVQHLIVCGHTGCRVFSNLLEAPGTNKGLLLHQYAEPTFRRALDVYGNIESEQLRLVMIQESLLQQADLIRTRRDVASRLAEGSLRLHVWIRDDKTSRIAVFDPNRGLFTPM